VRRNVARKGQHNKRGRPTKYSLAVARKISQSVEKGCSRRAAAALAGVSVSTLHEWREQFSDFSDRLEKADARFEESCVAAIRRAGKRPRNWTANSWLLERKFPESYGRIDRHVIRTEREVKPLPQDYIDAICNALGMTGKLVPRIEATVGSSDGHRVIDPEILP
jgi:hypothetical protein